MPFYYDINTNYTSNGSAATETDHLRLLTVAEQETCHICGIYAAARFGTAGGAQIRVKTFGTASSSGSSITPQPRNPNSEAANTTGYTAPTAGSSPATRLTVGMAQTGGMGGWVALEPSHAFALLANGGAKGNADFFSICNAATVLFDLSVEINEG